MNKAQYTMGGYSTPGYEHLHELQKWMTTEYARLTQELVRLLHQHLHSHHHRVLR